MTRRKFIVRLPGRRPRLRRAENTGLRAILRRKRRGKPAWRGFDAKRDDARIDERLGF